MDTVLLANSKAEVRAGLAKLESLGTFSGVWTGMCRLTHRHVLTNLHSRPTLLAVTLAWRAASLQAPRTRAHQALNGAKGNQADMQTCGRLLSRGDGTDPVCSPGSPAETWSPLFFSLFSFCMLASGDEVLCTCKSGPHTTATTGQALSLPAGMTASCRAIRVKLAR